MKMNSRKRGEKTMLTFHAGDSCNSLAFNATGAYIKERRGEKRRKKKEKKKHLFLFFRKLIFTECWH